MKPTDLRSYTPQTVLAVGAHADDIDFGASGSIAKWAAAGAAIDYMVITDGSKGSSAETTDPVELARLRQDEQRAAAKVLGARHVHFFDYEDGQLEVTQDLKKRLVRVIRSVRPDTVVVMDPTMVYISELGFVNHPDHRAAGQATLDAIYPLARDHLSFPELHAEGLAPHKVQHLLLINLEKQNYHEDITGFIDTKIAALSAHASQFSEESRTMICELAKKTGQQHGVEYAENFVRIDLP